eukprot:7754213-Pyramimonas_sp.AAC.1
MVPSQFISNTLVVGRPGPVHDQRAVCTASASPRLGASLRVYARARCLATSKRTWSTSSPSSLPSPSPSSSLSSRLPAAMARVRRPINGRLRGTCVVKA